MLYALLAWQEWFSGHEEILNGNPIKVSDIWKSGFHFLSNCHSKNVIMGRAWMLPLTGILAEVSIKLFLKCAWRGIKCDQYIFWVIRDHLKGSHPKEMAGVLLSKRGKGIRTHTSTKVMVSLEISRWKSSSYINWILVIYQFTWVEKLGIAVWVLFALRHLGFTYGTLAVLLVVSKPR